MPPASSPSAASNRGSLGLIFLIVVIDLLGFAIVLPLLPRYGKHLAAQPLTIGLLMASFSAMQFLCAPLWGRWSDRIGRRPALMAGLVGSVLSYALFGWASIIQSLPLLFVARIGAGIAGATLPTAQAYIADCTDLQGRSRGMALIGAAFGIGFTLGPVLGSVSLPQGAAIFGSPLNPLPGFLAAGFSLVALVLCYFRLPESMKAGTASTARDWFNLAAARDTLRVPSVGGVVLASFLAIFAFSQFETTLSLMTQRVFGLGDADNFWMFTYFGVTLAVLQGGVVRAVARTVPETTTFPLGIGLMLLGFLLVAWAIVADSFFGLIAAMPVVIGGFSFLMPSSTGLISRRSDPARQGEVMGVSQSAGSLARIVGPVTGNVLFGHGVSWPYVAAAALILPALALALVAVRTGGDWEA